MTLGVRNVFYNKPEYLYWTRIKKMNFILMPQRWWPSSFCIHFYLLSYHPHVIYPQTINHLVLKVEGKSTPAVQGEGSTVPAVQRIQKETRGHGLTSASLRGDEISLGTSWARSWVSLGKQGSPQSDAWQDSHVDQALDMQQNGVRGGGLLSTLCFRAHLAYLQLPGRTEDSCEWHLCPQ